MTPAVQQPSPDSSDGPAPRVTDTVPKPAQDAAVLARWLDAQCRMLPGVVTAIATFETDADGRPRDALVWPTDATPESATLDVAAMAFVRRVPVVAQAQQAANAAGVGLNVAYAFMRGNKPYGVVAVKLSVPAKQQQAVVQALRDGVRWLDFLLQSSSPAASPALANTPAANHDAALLHLIEDILAQPSADAAELTTVSSLAAAFGCQRVALGWRRRSHTALAAISDVPEVDRRVEDVHQIEACMDEAYAQDCAVAVPVDPGRQDELVHHHAHDVLSRTGGGRVCTVPLRHEGVFVGALTFEHASSDLDEAWLQACKDAVGVLGPPLVLTAERHGGLLSTTATRATARLRKWPLLRATMLVVLLMGIVSGAMSWALSQDVYVVAAEAELEGAVQRSLVAPFDGFLTAVDAKAGEVVGNGDVLAQLNTDEIELEVRRLEADREALDKRHRQALAALQMSEARIIHAQIAQVDARLELARVNASRATLHAPFEGIIIRGDLTHSLGKPVSRGDVLLEIAPLDNYRVTMEVEAQDVADVFVHQSGRLRLSALPGKVFPLEVANVATVAGSGAAEGRFRVEASLEGPTARLRPGMKGIARLDAGERPRLDGWIARLMAPVRVWWWRWSP